jgi:hypothetical protein
MTDEEVIAVLDQFRDMTDDQLAQFVTSASMVIASRLQSVAPEKSTLGVRFATSLKGKLQWITLSRPVSCSKIVRLDTPVEQSAILQVGTDAVKAVPAATAVSVDTVK